MRSDGELARLVAGGAGRSPTPSRATGRASSPARSRPAGCCSAACSASGSPRSCSATPQPSLWVSLAALFVVLVCASFGQAILQYAGAGSAPDHLAAGACPRRRRRCGAERGRRAGRRLGARRRGQRRRSCPGLSREVRDSAVLGRVNGVMPADAVQALRSFNDVVGSSFFPRYLEPFARERIVNVGPPPGAVAARPRRRSAPQHSVFKIRGDERLRPRRRGQRLPLRARPGDDQRARRRRGRQARRAGRRHARCRRRVVYYNPDIDVAVLAVDGARRPFLALRPQRQARRRRRRCSATRRTARTTSQAGPDPRRAAAAQPRHLRQRHRDPRGVLAAWRWCGPATPAARSCRPPAGCSA